MNHREKYPWIYDVLFLLVFLLAGYLRLTGVNWGEGGGQHPDENHFSGVLESLRAQKCADPAISVDVCPPEQKRWIGIGDYFNSATSPLSPYNRGYSFYVYGNLPMTIIRIAADATDQTNLRLFGRQFSAFADLFAILFLYLLVSRLYGRRVGLLASLFSALTVMQIQQSHFFTVDLFVNAFAFLALWFAVAILEHKEQKAASSDQVVELQEPSGDIQESNSPPLTCGRTVPRTPVSASFNPLFLLSVGFGFALGMAMASKINIAPLAIVLPAAFVLRYFIQNKESNYSLTDHWQLNSGLLDTGHPLSYRRWAGNRYFLPHLPAVCLLWGWAQPAMGSQYQEQRVQAEGDADLPWNLQWARRSHLFSFTNLTVWGLGLPLGILAWAGFLYMGWRILKGEWRHALLWGWTAVYFLWQSLQFNPTMRYQLPIYPLLAMMAAWFVFELVGLKC